jgi:O-antigen/teichoic acid export membrane protein
VIQNTGPLSWVRTAVQGLGAIAAVVLIVTYGLIPSALLAWPVPTVIVFVVVVYVAVRIQRWLNRW